MKPVVFLVIFSTAIVWNCFAISDGNAQSIPNPYADVVPPEPEMPAFVEEAAPKESTGILLTDELKSAAQHIQLGECPPEASAKEKPKYPTVIVSGIAQIDGIWFSQDEANRLVVGEALDDLGLRRARLGVKGALTENVSYMMEYDFAFPGRPSFMDVYVDIADLFDVGHFRVGQWRQPLGSKRYRAYEI